MGPPEAVEPLVAPPAGDAPVAGVRAGFSPIGAGVGVAELDGRGVATTDGGSVEFLPDCDWPGTPRTMMTTSKATVIRNPATVATSRIREFVPTLSDCL